MGFLSPITALIAAGITVPLLVSLYFLKLRRRQLAVSSTLLWKKAIRDMEVNAPFQKLRRNLLLLLQLLVLAALLIAMARPTFQTTAHRGERVVIVIDHSGSMNATDVKPSRLAQAKATALKLVDHLNTASGPAAADGAMIVSFAGQARVVQPFTSDTTRLRTAIESIKPTDEPSHLAPALRLLEPYASRAKAVKAKHGLVVYLLTDGRVQTGAGKTPTLSGADLRYLPIGARPSQAGVNNLGIVAFAARRQFDNPQQVQVFARLSNDATRPVKTHLILSIDGQVAQVESVTVPAAKGGESETINGKTVWPKLGMRAVQFSFSLPGSAMLGLRQDHADVLAADDTAHLVLASSRRLRVLLVTSGNAFLKRVITSAGVNDLVEMSPSEYENRNPQTLRRSRWNVTGAGVGKGFDVIVFDDYAPRRIPPVNSLYFGAVPPIQGLALKRTSKDAPKVQMVLDWKRDNPFLRYVTLDDVVMQTPGRLVLPNDATVLATGEEGPIMAEVTRGAVHQVIVSFDILNSNWPLYVSFPVFMSNALQTLGLGAPADQAGRSYTAGQTVVVPVSSKLSSVTYTGPTQTLRAAVRDGQAALPMFARVGVYTTKDNIAAPYDKLAVNMLNARESDLRPAARLRVGASMVTGTNQSKMVRQEVWPWFAWAALGLLLVEWFFYTRRMHL